MQVHSWLTYGYLQSADFSLIYPFFAAVTLIVTDFILGFKIGVALLGGLLVASVYFSLVRRDVLCRGHVSPALTLSQSPHYLLSSPIPQKMPLV